MVQRDLVEQGLSAQVISNFFRGLPVKPRTANRIVEKLGLTTKCVMIGQSKTEPHKRQMVRVVAVERRGYRDAK